MKFEIRFDTGQFKGFADAAQSKIAQAATAAIADVGAKVKTQGRAAIASAGFGVRWQNAFRVDLYPKGGGPSLRPAAFIYHKIPYADIYETGGTIRGNPVLWLPIEPNLPARGGRWTPARYVREIGPLASAEHGNRPYLVTVPRRIGSRRRGAARSPRAIPVFVGISSVEAKKRFDIESIIRQAADELPALFEKYLTD